MLPHCISSNISLARSILILPSRISLSATLSISSPFAPAIAAIFFVVANLRFEYPKNQRFLRAWSFMCPLCIPSETRALRAAKFCAKPKDAPTQASSFALWTFKIFKETLLKGEEVAPPMIPHRSGSSMLPDRSPSSVFSNVVKEW